MTAQRYLSLIFTDHDQKIKLSNSMISMVIYYRMDDNIETDKLTDVLYLRLFDREFAEFSDTSLQVILRSYCKWENNKYYKKESPNNEK